MNFPQRKEVKEISNKAKELELFKLVEHINGILLKTAKDGHFVRYLNEHIPMSLVDNEFLVETLVYNFRKKKDLKLN